MLTDTEKQRIQLEESYRQEVRAELGASQSLTLWRAINSSFGLWLLSALFISGAGTLYTSCQGSREAKEKRREEVERLDFEIGYRFSQIQSQLCVWATEVKKVEEQETRIRGYDGLLIQVAVTGELAQRSDHIREYRLQASTPARSDAGPASSAASGGAPHSLRRLTYA